MKAIHYAQALWELESEEKTDDRTLHNFVQCILRRGHAHLLRKVLVELEHIAKRAEDERTIHIVSAKPLTESEVVTLLRKEPFKHALAPSHTHVVRKIDGTLVGGAMVKTSTRRVDGSHKRLLLDLYQSLIRR